MFGGLDGIITTFAVVTSVNGAELTTGVIIVLVRMNCLFILTFKGIANLIADALGMAFGEYISEKSEHEWIEKERTRECWEFDNFKEVCVSPHNTSF